MQKIILNGWPLDRAPGSPSARQLEILLAVLPSQIPLRVALPGPEISSTPWGQLLWDQWRLPRQAVKAHASVLQLFDVSLPLLSTVPLFLFPTAPIHQDRPASSSWMDRLYDSAAEGSRSRTAIMLWPSDLPEPEIPPAWKLVRIPPVVHPAFRQPGGNLPAEIETELPDQFILCPGPLDHASLEQMISAWAWAAGSIGGSLPLLLHGVDQLSARSLVAELNLDDSVFFCPTLPLNELASLYARCAAVVYPQRMSPWGDMLRPAMACGKPVVSFEYAETAACAGPAAYLAPPADDRALGAAMITVAVEEELAQQLSQAGLERCSRWSEADFTTTLLEVYTQKGRALQ